MPIITLLTDFGTADSYVAEMKGAILSRAPGATLVDISHRVSAGDVRAAQYLLSRTWAQFPRGSVHLAVVDPGVGTKRRALAAESAGHHFLAPDNGLLSFLAPDARFVSLPVPASAAPTFHGRDLFAPAAAALVLGEPIDSLGDSVSHPVRAPLPVHRIEKGIVIGEVIHVDQFGSLVSNIPPSSVAAGSRVRAAGTDVGPIRRTFADVSLGALVAVVGSGATIEIAVRDGSAAAKLGVGVGAEIRIEQGRR
ncbi:MAG TPA: SAM-dependent chlorinase/fluorinase [Gemmatimonadales bacterium]|nr:SAM-dependent chlorinase/fluorinase [Gemmatimonadales bacterium]